MTTNRLTRRDMIRHAGVDEDAARFWLRERLIIPIGAGMGRGKHSQFTRDHVRLAAILAQARTVGLNIGALRVLAAALNKAIDVIDRYQLDGSAWETLTDELEERAQTPEQRQELTVEDLQKARTYQAEHPRSDNVRDAAEELTSGLTQTADIVLSFLASEGMLLLGRDKEEAWVVEIRNSIESSLPRPAYVLLDLRNIFASIVWDDAK